MIVQQSSNWHKLIHWRSKGTSRTGNHCSFVSRFPLEQRQIKATRRKEKKAEDCTDGAIWAQTEITSDFNSWEMRWHQRNLICVIHNRKIGRNAASDRYSIFNMTVSFRSFQFFGATLCSTATSKINLNRLRDLEIYGPLSKCPLWYWSRILPLILCLWSPIPGFWSQIPPLSSLIPHTSLRLCNYIFLSFFVIEKVEFKYYN